MPENGRPRGVSSESTVTIDFVIHFSPEYWNITGDRSLVSLQESVQEWSQKQLSFKILFGK